MIVESNPDVLAAWTLHKEVGEFIQARIGKLPSANSVGIFWRTMRESVAKNCGEQEQRPRKRKPAKSYEEAMSLVEAIRDSVGDICEAGQDFAASVEEKTEAIAESVERSMSATENQIAALENMLDGLRRWFHD